MLACRKCGHENADGSRFCEACAEPLTSDVVASGEAMDAFLQRNRTDALASPVFPPRGERRSEGAYVRWSAWPWGALRTSEQTYNQFVLTSAIIFFVIALFFLELVALGQPLFGGVFVLVAVALWFVGWRVGRS